MIPTEQLVTSDECASEATIKVRARGITRRYGTGAREVHALGPVDLDITSGEFICLVGPSGCGKSTFLRVVAGLIPPSEGRLEIVSESSAPVSSVVFQDYSIYPWKTVEQNVRFGLDVLKVSRSEANERVGRVLGRLGLADFRDAFPGTLSGGMKQRVSIARALVTEPQMLLMDEPFAALDAQLRHILQDELLQLWQEDRRTVLFVTHNLDEALLLGDRVLVMGSRPGTIVAEVPVPFDRPRTGDIRRSPEFAELESHIWDLLRGELTDAALLPEEGK
jgi:NitT/TauT family transport system ATP-binding protein